MKKKLYLAGPLFTAAERTFNETLATALRTMGYEVWLPQQNEPRELTAKAVFDMDVAGMDWADAIVANMDGPDPDSGTCFECGYAYANGKPVLCYRTDFRGAGDIGGAKYNLMLWASAAANVQMEMGAEVYFLARIIENFLENKNEQTDSAQQIG